MKHIKKFNENNISKESINDLISLRDELEFIKEYNVDMWEVIELIDKIIKSTLEDIEEWREHLTTNYKRSNKDELTIRLIDRFVA